MYRAVTWSVLQHGVDPADKGKISKFITSLKLGVELKNGEFRLRIDDVDLTPHLQEDRVNKDVSRVSTVPEVRRILVERMRSYATRTRSGC